MRRPAGRWRKWATPGREPYRGRLRLRLARRKIAAMASNRDLASTAPANRWTGIHAYLRPLRRRSGWRRRLSARPKRDPDRPNALLATVPFVALAIGLAMITVAIVTLAWPGQYREQMRPQAKPQEAKLGTAPPGWIDGYAARVGGGANSRS